MPGASSGYLPPVVATLVGESADALAKVEELKLALEDLTKSPTEIDITANNLVAIEKAVQTQQILKSMPAVEWQIAWDASRALAQAEAIRVAAQAMAAKPISFVFSADATPLIAEMGIIAALSAAWGGKGGGTGALGNFLWGRGGFAGFAPFGSIASLMGFGFEHLMTTVLGLAGSLSGALAGGALIAGGALAKLSVGMGSDMAVMQSTIADTKTLYTDYNNLAQAIAVYGKNSIQAKTATAQLSYDMTVLGNTAGVKAEAALARQVVALNTYWDLATSNARVAAVGILSQGVTLAREYIPLIAAAATLNLSIIGKDIKPLMAWLATTGKSIFGQLEAEFAHDLPFAMNAFTQGIELVLRILAYASQFTGGFIQKVSAWLTLWNSAAKTETWQKYVRLLIGMFHDWLALLKQVGITIVDVFKQSAGLGTNIVVTLTQMLKQLDNWLTSTSGKASLHNLFTVHLQEIDALLRLLPSLIGSFGRLYLMVAPQLTEIVVIAADIVGWLLKIPVAGPMLGWALAVGFLLSRMKLLGPVISILSTGLLPLLLRGLMAIIPGFDAAAVSALGLDGALDANPISLIVLGIAALAAGIVLLVLNFKKVTSFLNSEWGTAFQIALAVVLPFIGIPLLIITHWNQVLTFFRNLPGWIMSEIKALPGQILKFFEALPGWAWQGLTHGLPALARFFIGLYAKILGWLGNVAVWLLKTGVGIIGGLLTGLLGALPNILKFFIELPFRILALLVGAAWWLLKTGVSLLNGLIQGIIQTAPKVWNWFLALPGKILSFLVNAGIWLLLAGIHLVTGFLGGITKTAPSVWTWFTQLPGKILGFFTGAATWLFNIGKDILNGLWNGIKSVWNSVTSWFKGIGGDIGGFFKNALGIHSPSTVMHEIGQNVMLGLQMGLAGGVGGVLGVMSGMSNQLKSAISPGKLALSGQANATILHSLAASSLPASSVAMGASAVPTAAGVAGGSQTMTVPIALNVTVPAGTPSSVANQIGVATQAAVEKAVYKAVRQMKGGARQYGFVPG